MSNSTDRALDAAGQTRTVGVLALARPTFDVAYAEEMRAGMMAALPQTGHHLLGGDELLFDLDAARAAMDAVEAQSPDIVLILQTTFTDAMLAAEAARRFRRLAIWAVPEPRVGGRLRLNSFCGLNLAAHAVGRIGRPLAYLYATPDAVGLERSLAALLSGETAGAPPTPRAARAGDGAGARAARSLRGTRIGRVGERPAGFDTCDYRGEALKALADVTVDELALDDLFGRARAASAKTVGVLRAEAEKSVSGLDAVEQDQLDRSLRLKTGLDAIRAEGRYDALAIRCWPETFTEYGGAVCGPVAMMGEARVPCACEADVYGALSQLLVQRVAEAPVFLADLVDIDVADDTAVVWHCGQAPISMAAPSAKPRATIHTNRRMPLLYEFPLKPGRVTLFRVSQALGRTAAVIGGADMLDRRMAFTGTSGVLRFDAGSAEALSRIVGGALEHHLVIAYGDHRAALEGAAAELGLPVLEL